MPARLASRWWTAPWSRGRSTYLSDEEVVQRVSDIFTKLTDPFVVVFDATAEGKSGRVLILNKRNIAWVSPEDDLRAPEEDEKPADVPGLLDGPSAPDLGQPRSGLPDHPPAPRDCGLISHSP